MDESSIQYSIHAIHALSFALSLNANNGHGMEIEKEQNLSDGSVRQLVEPFHEMRNVLGKPNQSSLSTNYRRGGIVENDSITDAILPDILLSAMKLGILPPGVLEVAMHHSILPFSSSMMRSTLT
jgi:hypothetical protein